MPAYDPSITMHSPINLEASRDALRAFVALTDEIVRELRASELTHGPDVAAVATLDDDGTGRVIAGPREDIRRGLIEVGDPKAASAIAIMAESTTGMVRYVLAGTSTASSLIEVTLPPEKG